ncbi:DUF1000-domain-containing protein [Daldinia sp. FL1419]|nr:DUF1000-domain-containing protein [Daldinia sp. FL1419]
MASPIEITSAEQFKELLKSSRIVVADFYATWCGPCTQIAPFYERLSKTLSRPKVATFVKVNTEAEGAKAVATEYRITALPTFIVFRDGSVAERVTGANPKELQTIVENLSQNIENAKQGEGSDSGYSAGTAWRGADLPRSYTDVTGTVVKPRAELLNVESSRFSVVNLFDSSKPSALSKDKASDGKIDWIESDVDEQLLLYVAFNSSIKLHTLQITSLPPEENEDDEDEPPMRPGTLKLFANPLHNLDFSEAESADAAHVIEIRESDWNSNGTVSLGMGPRFVRFQNITSLVIFVQSGAGSGDKVRLDRIRFIGESGEKREMGKLEKIGDEQGE